MTQQPDEMENYIREIFENNYQHIRQETGQALSPYAKDLALQQVIMYWRKMRDLAESITETEVNLNLPAQKTPAGREFNIDGVVDILRERDKVTMYDIKTHDPDYVRNNIDLYSDQMNVYAHIWQKLRGQNLNNISIIATHLPNTLRHAIARNDVKTATEAFEQWNPEVPIEFSDASVSKTIKKFGEVVDNIEGGNFAPAPFETLKQPVGHRGRSFAIQVCAECDARFSCVSYRKYQGFKKGEKGKTKTFFSDLGTSEDQNERLDTVSTDFRSVI